MSTAGPQLPLRLTRTMTGAQVDDYPVALETAASGRDELATIEANIHTDEEFARAQGLPGRVADGMIVGNWLYQALVEIAGAAALEQGAFRVKFIRPIVVGDVIELIVESAAEAAADGVLALALRAERAGGELCVVGSAELPLTIDPRSDSETR